MTEPHPPRSSPMHLVRTLSVFDVFVKCLFILNNHPLDAAFICGHFCSLGLNLEREREGNRGERRREREKGREQRREGGEGERGREREGGSKG